MVQEAKQEVINICTQIIRIVVKQKSSLEMFSGCWLWSPWMLLAQTYFMP